MSTINPYQPEIQEILTHVHGLSGDIPLHRRESKRGYSFSKLPFADQLTIWDLIWRTERGFRPSVHAFFFLERHMKKEAQLLEMWPVIVKWQDQVDDWGLCDSLSKIYTRILEIIPGEVYPQLQSWNIDKDLWKRRQSIVSLLYYSRTKKVYLTFDEISYLVIPLITDKEYYVQKGVGWTLRELHNIYPEQAIGLIKSHIKQLSGIAFSTSIEKMSPTAVNELKMMRK